MEPLRVTCFCDGDLVLASYAVCGFIELANAGEIELSFRRRDPSLRRLDGAHCMWLRISSGAGDVGVMIDCHDRAGHLDLAGLRACQYYFKSNFGAETRQHAPAEAHAKLRALGPYLPCRPHQDRQERLRWWGSITAKLRQRWFSSQKPRSPYQHLQEFRNELLRLRRYRSRKTWSEYESPPQPIAAAKSAPILFNPSCWDEAEGEPVRVMNEFRAKLICALRAEFSDRFVGGFRRLGPSYSRYPEAVETATISHDQYLDLLRRSPVVVYTNGKWDCYSWRFAESLAASKCIVSETIPNAPGPALNENLGIVQCASVEEIVAAVRRFDCNPELAHEYALRCHRFYVEAVRPQSRMRLLLKEVLGEPNAYQAALFN